MLPTSLRGSVEDLISISDILVSEQPADNFCTPVSMSASAATAVRLGRQPLMTKIYQWSKSHLI